MPRMFSLESSLSCASALLFCARPFGPSIFACALRSSLSICPSAAAAEIIARIVEQAFYELDAAPMRVCSAEVPIPYARHLEQAALPQVPAIVAAAHELCG